MNLGARARKLLNSYFTPTHKLRHDRNKVPELAFSPKALARPASAEFMDEFVAILRVPIVWTTVTFYGLILFGIVSYLASDRGGQIFFLLALITGLVWLIFLYFLWQRLEHNHHTLRTVILNILFSMLSGFMGWGTYFAWQTMSEAHIGIIATMIGSILGGATTILSHSRLRTYLSS